MNSIKKLKENVASFMAEIAAHYGIPKSEVVAALREINFYCLYQTLCREAIPVFTFRACGDKEGQQPFSGEKLFPCCAINLYRVSDYGTENEYLANVHIMEVWLREDLTLAVTSCFHVDNKMERYRTNPPTSSGKSRSCATHPSLRGILSRIKNANGVMPENKSEESI